MKSENLIIDKLEGFSGIRLKDKRPLVLKPGINLLVGRNGCGKTNLMRLIETIATGQGDLTGHIESSYFIKKGQASLRKRQSNIANKFGEVIIVKHSLKGAKGSISMSLKNVNEEFILKNIINDPNGFHGSLKLKCKTKPVKHLLVHANVHPPKFERSGYLTSSHIFSQEPNNVVHASMQGPMQTVSEFIKARLKEFYESQGFINQIQTLENAVNEKFSRFLTTSNKRVKIDYNDLAISGRIYLSLMDKENYIQSANISTGEAMLFNLVFSLASAKQECCEILSLDEPDVHMHDDMIRVLVGELTELTQALPSCIIIVASHSTALIEQLAALGKKLVHIITFDSERNVVNSENDIDLINALERNGVHFSPLMLSKRKNLFIENQFEKGGSHKNFFLKFFSSEDLPNVVPIGNSGNVQDSKSFSSVFKDILKIPNLNFAGIQDGDIWFKPQLVKYLKAELTLPDIVKTLKNKEGMYISQGKSNPNAYYFNCWEIENLYLMDEVLSCWRLKNGTRLNKSEYKALLTSRQSIISNQYLDTFYKSITKIRINKKYSVQTLRPFLQEKFDSIEKSINATELDDRMGLLVDAIFEDDLLHWAPGKELRSLLLREKYTFDDSEFDFKNSQLGVQLRRILTT